MTDHDDKITVAALGDIILGEGLCGLMRGQAGREVFDRCFRDADFVFGNLEGPLGNGYPQANPEKICLSQSPGALQILKEAGFHLVSVGNNHILDYGGQGLVRTLEALEQTGLRFIGAGRNEAEARRAVEYEIRRQRICFLHYTDSSTELSFPLKAAGTGEPGLNLFDWPKVLEDVRVAKESGSDRVIVSLHWGVEGFHYPEPGQIDTARRIIEAGADAVLGHHSHVFQSIEPYQGGVICYSLGNFLFDRFELPDGRPERWLRKNRLSACVRLSFSKGQPVRCETIPFGIDGDLFPRLLEGDDAREARRAFQKWDRAVLSGQYPWVYRKECFTQGIVDFLEKGWRRFKRG